MLKLVITALLVSLISSNYLANNLNNVIFNRQPNAPETYVLPHHHHDKKPIVSPWKAFGRNPNIDIRYKRLIAEVFKFQFLNLYMSITDKQHSKVSLIFGQKSRKPINNKDILNLVFVIKYRNQIQSFVGMRIKICHGNYYNDYSKTQITKFVRSDSCKDALKVLNITEHDFSHGPSLDFINYSTLHMKSKLHLNLANHSQKDRECYRISLDRYIKQKMAEFNRFILQVYQQAHPIQHFKFPYGSSHHRPHEHHPHHNMKNPVFGFQRRPNVQSPPLKDVYVGLSNTDDTNLDQ